jgi:hypothetical protein
MKHLLGCARPRTMSTRRRRTEAPGWALLFAASAFCFAQNPAQDNFAPADLSFTRSGGNRVAQFKDDASFPSTNAATASLERALASAVTEKFSPLGFDSEAGDEEEFTSTFFSGAMLLGEAELPPILLAQNQGSPPNPAPAKPSEPNLGDLGFPTAQTQGSTQDQARLDRRSHMLKIHQRLGLITTIPLAATLLTGGLAGGKSTSSTGRDVHATLGTITVGMYLTTSYYSIFAPKIAGTTTRGPIRLHKILALIHGPGMILTPILGAMAFDQKNAGEKVHGIASAHGAVAAVTGIAYGLAILSVSVHF